MKMGIVNNGMDVYVPKPVIWCALKSNSYGGSDDESLAGVDQENLRLRTIIIDHEF